MSNFSWFPNSAVSFSSKGSICGQPILHWNIMSENDRKRRSKWDNKEEDPISARTSEQNDWQERERYPRRSGLDPKSYNLESDYLMDARDSPEHRSRKASPRMRGQRDGSRDSYDISRSRRPGDVAQVYSLSPRNYAPSQQNHIHSPERTRDYPRRSRSRGRGTGRSQSPIGGRNRRSPSGGGDRSRSPSPSRGRERDRGYGRSRSPSHDYRRDPHGGFNDRRSEFRGPPPQVCRNFTAGDCRRGSQCRFLHPDNPGPRDGGRSERDLPERDLPERWGPRGERGRNHYDVEREDLARNRNPDVCSDFLKGRCRWGSTCRFSHDAAGENSHERQQHITPCKFFMMGNCSRANCRFAHDAPIQDNHEVVPGDDRRKRDHGEKNSTWNGPTWNEAEKSGRHMVAKDGGRSESPLDDVAGGSDVRGAMGWDDRGSQNLVKTEPVITQRDNYERNHMDGESEKWNGGNIHEVDMETAGSEPPNDVTKMQSNSTMDNMQYHTPYDFSKPTSTVAHSEFPENPQLYDKMRGNVSSGRDFVSVNVGNAFGNAKQATPMPGQDFNKQLPPQQFGGMGQGPLLNSINPSGGRNVDYSGPVHENISHFKGQNSTVSHHEVPGNQVTNLSMPQKMEQKPVQISNLPPMTEKFVNEHLPQLYAVLNPPTPAGPMPSNPESVNLFPPLSSINTQPDQTSIYQKRTTYGTEPKELGNTNQYQGFSSNSINQKDGSVTNNHMSSQLSQEKIVPEPVPEEPSKPISEKPNREAKNNGAGNVEADKKDGDGGNLKDDKAMRLFKNSLVEFVKDILKPKWKEGGMSRDVHKAIVKKVVDKVTGATQGVNIPSTQAKLDQYLESSRPKLAKLVEAYVERYAKTS